MRICYIVKLLAKLIKRHRPQTALKLDIDDALPIVTHL
jgi:hypothetical protein